MPRQKPRRTDLDTRLRNMTEILGRPGLAGLSRVGGQFSGTGSGQSVLFSAGSGSGADTTGAAQLLVMSATGDSIAPSGDNIGFDTVVAQHGFAGVVATGDGAWVHPVDAVYVLHLEFEWDTYQSGGTIQLLVDDIPVPEGLFTTATAGERGAGAIFYVAGAGSVGRISVTHGAGSALTCSATARIAVSDPQGSGPVFDHIGGNAVSLGTQASPTVPAWSGVPSGWVDSSAHWIWHTTGTDQPDGVYGWFQGIYDSIVNRPVTVEATSDNFGTLYLNGTLLGSIDNIVRQTFSVTLNAGRNQFTAVVQNDPTPASPSEPNPAGFLLSVRDATSGDVIFRTTDAGGWYASTTEPAGWPNP